MCACVCLIAVAVRELGAMMATYSTRPAVWYCCIPPNPSVNRNGHNECTRA